MVFISKFYKKLKQGKKLGNAGKPSTKISQKKEIFKNKIRSTRYKYLKIAANYNQTKNQQKTTPSKYRKNCTNIHIA